MKVAVVGCGNVSNNHFKALQEVEGIEIVATVDIKPERAESSANKYGGKAYTDFELMLKSEKPDCVHIATPHYLHTPMAIKALENGANVFLEKPCSVTKEEANALIKAQKVYNKQVGVCFQNRYNNNAIIMKELLDSGTLGKMKAIRAFVTWCRGEEYYSDDWHGTLDKECGGVLINQAIHTLDLVQYFCNGCKSVRAHTFNDHLEGVIQVEDTVSARMEMGNGVIALFYATTAYGSNAGVFIEAETEKATLRLEGESLIRFTDGKPEILCEKSNKEFAGKSYWGHGHSAIIKDFYDCLNTGRKFQIDALEGAKAAKTVAACYESSTKNINIEVDSYDT